VDRQIVGIAEDGPSNSVREDPAPYLYLPFAQAPRGEFTLLLETEGDAGRIAGAVRQQLRAAGAEFELLDLLTWRENLKRANFLDRSMSLTANGLAGVGIILAVGGLFGMLLYSVSRRTRDFGVRLALGARRWDIVRDVLSDSLRIAAIGVPLGLAGALLLARYARAVLFGVQPVDPLSLALTVAGVLGVVLLATLWPARRAAQVDPIQALRYE